MSEVLSQDEVDSLLTGLSSGKVETEGDKPDKGKGIDLYDFSSQERVIRGRLPTFEVINERFAREMRTSLNSLLHATVDVGVDSIDTLKFSEFGRSLPVPTSLHIFRMDPLRGHALLVLETQLVYNLIDTFFGGKGTGKSKIEGREFTTIEEVMIKKVVLACMDNLEDAWAPAENIRAVYVRSEVNPQFATIVVPTDLVIVARFEIELEQSVGNITLCLPYSMIEPLRPKLSAGFQSDHLEIDLSWQKRIKEIIFDSTINLNIELGKTEITGRRLLHMKVGDVIQLDNDADQSLMGYIEDVPKFTGYAGIQRGFQAFRIDNKLKLE